MDSIIESQVKLAKELDEEVRKYEANGDRTEPTLRALQTTVAGIWKKVEINHKVLVDNKEDQKANRYFESKVYDTLLQTKDVFCTRIKIRLDEAARKANSALTATTSNEKGTTAAEKSEQPNDTQQLRQKLLNRIEFMERNSDFALRGLENGSISLLQERIDDLKSEWKGLVEIYRKILDNGRDDDDEKLYFDAKDKFEKTISKVKECIRVSSEVKLPTVNIPTFNGRDPKDWPSFFDLFRKTIHENVHLSGTQKMQYLKTYTREKALNSIQHLTISDKNYETAWELLCEKYHNVRKIVDNYISTILSAPRAIPNDARSLRSLHDTLKECMYGISNMGFDVEACAIFFNHIVSEKLDRDTKRRFEQSLGDPKKIPPFGDLLLFLEEQADTLEAIQTPQSSNNNKNNTTISKGGESSEKQACFVCKKEHTSIIKCNEFMKMNAQERLDKVRVEKVCRMCFGKHNADSCNSKYTCKKCSGRHSTLIHVETKKKTIIANAVMNELKQVLLATALVKCKTINNDYIMLRAMIDQASQGTFITEEAAQLLQLKREKISAEVDGFANTGSTKSKSMIKIEMGSNMDPDFMAIADALVVKRITKPLPQEPVNTESWHHLRNLPLADPNYNIPAPIDISIGSDSFGEFALCGLIKGEAHMPYAQLTTLGWIVMGRTENISTRILINTWRRGSEQRRGNL